MENPDPTLAQFNAVQLAGIVSDLCVTWADVAERDMARAMEWIKQNCSDL